MKFGRLRAKYFFAAFMVAAAACGSAPEDLGKGRDQMLGTLMDIVREADAVVLVRFGRSEKVTVKGHPFLRVHSEVLRTLQGLPPGAAQVAFEVPDLGPGTARIDPGLEAILFLKGESGGRWTLVDLSEPLIVEKEEREAVIGFVNAYIKAAAPGSGQGASRLHVIAMLESGNPFFQDDASSTATVLSSWTEAEIDTLISLVRGTEERSALEGMARENIEFVIVRNADRERVVSFGRELLEQGEFRGVYLGLDELKPDEAGEIVNRFLEDPEEAVQIGGLQVAGLLRRADLLDAYEKRNEGKSSGPIRAAIEKAREYVDRDL